MLNIKQRQLNLRCYHYFYTGKIDGIEGSGTKNAYRNFQKYTGLTVDGIYGRNTNNKLIEVIKDLQGKLNIISETVSLNENNNTITKIINIKELYNITFFNFFIVSLFNDIYKT